MHVVAARNRRRHALTTLLRHTNAICFLHMVDTFIRVHTLTHAYTHIFSIPANGCSAHAYSSITWTSLKFTRRSRRSNKCY